MFWRFGYQNASSLDTLLENEDTTLEQIFNEEELLQEVKTRNEKLISFLVQADNLKEMVNYVVSDHEDSTDDAKFAYLATEILCCEVEELVNSVLEDKILLDRLCSILDRPAPLTPLHANSFVKIMGIFITRNTLQMLAYIKAKQGLLEKLLQHLESTGISDLLLRLMTSDDFHDGRDVETWLGEQNLIERIVLKMHPDSDEMTLSTVSFTLMDMLSAFHSAQDPNPNLLNESVLIKQLKSEKIVSRLTSNMLGVKGPNSSSCIIYGCNILIELLRRGTCAEDYDEVASVLPEGGEFGNLPAPPPPVHREALEIDELVTVIIKNIPDLKDVLVSPRKPMNPIDTSNGRMTPLGQERLTVTELLAELLRAHKKEVYESFLENGVISSCLDLFFSFQWNNLLHMVVCDIIHTTFDSPFDMARGLIISIFTDVELTKRILQAVRYNNYLIEKPKGVRLGYMGHITILTDKICLFFERILDEKFEELTNAYVKSEDWLEYINKIHRETKEKESKPLGGRKPQFSSQDTDDDVPFSMHVDLNTDQLARYMIQQVVADLPDKFSIAGAERKEEIVWSDLTHESTFDLQTNNFTTTDFEHNDEEESENEDDAGEKWPKVDTSSFFSEKAKASVTAQVETAFPTFAKDPMKSPSVTTSSGDHFEWTDFSQLSVQETNELKVADSLSIEPAIVDETKEVDISVFQPETSAAAETSEDKLDVPVVADIEKKSSDKVE